jgi:hypothetical protein
MVRGFIPLAVTASGITPASGSTTTVWVDIIGLRFSKSFFHPDGFSMERLSSTVEIENFGTLSK